MRIICTLIGYLLFSIAYGLDSDSVATDSLPIDISISDNTAEPKLEYIFNRGLEHYSSKDFLQAVACFDSCLSIADTFTQARFLRALSLEKEGKLDSAFIEYKKIKETNPGYQDIDKRLRNYYITKYLSTKWYYMLAMLRIKI